MGHACSLKSSAFTKKRAQEMSCSGKVSRTFEFLHIFGFAEKSPSKILRAAEKNKEKVAANCTWLLGRVLWFSVSRYVLFFQENKSLNVDNSLLELDKNPPASS